MDERERYKQLVGAYAADMVQSNTVIGLGTGSTATHFVASLAALRAMPADQLLEAIAGRAPQDFTGVIDGYFLPRNPTEVFVAGEQV